MVVQLMHNALHSDVQAIVWHAGLRKCMASEAVRGPRLDALNMDEDNLDLLLIHLTSTAEEQAAMDRQCSAPNLFKDRSREGSLSFLDEVVGEIDAIVGIKETLLLVILMNVVRLTCFDFLSPTCKRFCCVTIQF